MKFGVALENRKNKLLERLATHHLLQELKCREHTKNQSQMKAIADLKKYGDAITG